MASFAVFTDERLEGVDGIVASLNDTLNTIRITCIWDATTEQLGRAAFSHHLVFPSDILVVAPSILDVFSYDEEARLCLPRFSTTDAAVAHYVQTLNAISLELMSLPVPPQVIFSDLVGVDTLTWPAAFGDAVVQMWVDSIVPGVNEEIGQLNSWNGVPSVPLGHRILYSRVTPDRLIRVHDFRAMVDGFLPNPRQLGRWARVLMDLLRMFVYIN